MDIYNLEKTFINFLAHIWGFEAAVRIEDFLMIICTLLLGYFLGQLRIAFLAKPNFMFTDKLKSLVFQKNEHKGVTQVDFKYPRTLLEKIEFIVALHLANRKKTKLSVVKAKWYSRIAVLILIILLIILVFIIAFMYNVVLVEDMPNV